MEDNKPSKPKKENKKVKKKKKKVVYVDDGHTVYSMEALSKTPPRKGTDPKLTRKERRAAIFAALGHFLPILLLVLTCFIATGLLLWLWLMH